MTNFPRWNEVRADIVAGSGGEEAMAQARRRNQARIDAYRLAERRKTLGLSQTEVADRMGVTKSRVSQIEQGEVATVEAIYSPIPSTSSVRSPSRNSADS